MDRFWEAHDFIIKAMTSHDEPVQLGERAFPLSPGEHLAAAMAAAASAGVEHDGQQDATREKLGRARLVMATLGTGYATRALYDAYREGYACKRPARRRRRSLRLSRLGGGRAQRDAKRAGAASWSRAIRASARIVFRRSAIRPAISRSRTMCAC